MSLFLAVLLMHASAIATGALVVQTVEGDVEAWWPVLTGMHVGVWACLARLEGNTE